MALYESEHTTFMREWMAKNPQELDEQKQGRALWWDKPAEDLDTQQRRTESRVPNKPYYYDAN
jgi:hypothetical protein